MYKYSVSLREMFWEVVCFLSGVLFAQEYPNVLPKIRPHVEKLLHKIKGGKEEE